MSSFAEILRGKRHQEEDQHKNQHQQEQQEPHHRGHNKKGHSRRDESDIDIETEDVKKETAENSASPPKHHQQSNSHNHHHHQPPHTTSSWATRLQQSTASNTPSNSEIGPTVSVPAVSAPRYSEEESNSISAENQRTLQYLLSYVPYYPIMVVLCGIPGSGKSTFARRLIASIPVDYRPYWISLNQDALGDRKTVMQHTEYALTHHQNTIIDRCNFNEEQRSPWVELAQTYHIPAVVAFVLPDHNNVALCADRAYKRGNSDGVHPGNPDWNNVCARINEGYSDPTLAEGFSGIYKCRHADDVASFIESVVHAYDVMPRPHSDAAAVAGNTPAEKVSPLSSSHATSEVTGVFVENTVDTTTETH